MFFQKFLGGIHIQYNKERTENTPITPIPMPPELYLYLGQHIGKPSEKLVAPEQYVKKGEMIAKPSAYVSAALHAPTSGTIKEIKEMSHPTSSRAEVIVLVPDGLDTAVDGYGAHREWRELFPQELIAIVQNSGIVGLGGAAFPSHVKLTPPAGTEIKTILINGAECEPYLTSDDAIMKAFPNEIAEGIDILLKVSGADKAILGIEKNKPEAIAKMKAAAKNIEHLEVVALPVKYPQGAERNLIKALTNFDLPPGKLPLQFGMIVINSTTTFALQQAVACNKPLTHKVVTVSGPAVLKPANYLVPLGTSWEYLLSVAETDRSKMVKLVMGGPMMGISQSSVEAATVKGTSGLLAFTEEEVSRLAAGPCIRCGRCSNACSSGLMPNSFSYYTQNRLWGRANETKVLNCVECGACSFVCPANRRMLDEARILKYKIREKSAVVPPKEDKK